MEQGQFAYRQSLERARKAVLDRKSQYAAPEAAQVVEQKKQGLMRPNARPEPEEQGGFVSGIGLALMESMSAQATPEGSAEQQYRGDAPAADKAPKARPGSTSTTNMKDRDLLALTLQAEAAGEGLDGMLAAGAVIRNRADSGKYGKGIRGVILKPGQFSAWNLQTGYAGGEGGIDMDNLNASEEAYEAADRLLSGNYEDVTGGATHYYNPNVATPKWGSEAGGDWTDIGNHRFGWGDGNPGSA